MTTTPRRQWVARLAAYLAHHHAPRFEMSLILATTALAGFVSSRAMLGLGLEAMYWRYPLATLVSYVAFLVCVGIWVRSYADTRLPQPPDPPPSAVRKASGGGDLHGLENADLAGVSDEGCLLVLLGLLAVGFAFAAWLLIAGAPTLLAELLLESSVLGVLYPSLRTMPRHGWLRTAFRRTRTAVALFVLGFALLGMLLHQIAPEASSIGETWRMWRERP
jgi:hypothetical protein